MDGPGHPGRDAAQGRAPGLRSEASAPPRPRIAIVSNGNYFAALGLAPLLQARSRTCELQILVTTGLRRPERPRWRELASLARRWGPRYAGYKAGMLALPALAQMARRRPYSLSAVAREHGVAVRRCRDLHESPVFERLVEFAPDLLISFSCPYRLKLAVLALPRLGALNVHSSLLPAYAGVSTYVHVLADGQERTGVSVHVMTERLDAGPILAQREIAIPPACSVFELFSRQCRAGGRLLEDVVGQALRTRTLQGQRQDPGRRTYHSEPRAMDIVRLRRRGHRLFSQHDLRELWSSNGAVTP
jgi:folate-dependent phosphoribosylglycinamide formyltransferase PurN